MVTSTTPRRRRLAEFLLFAIACVSAIAFIEVFCRLALPPPGVLPFESDYVPDLFTSHPERGYTYNRNFSGRQVSPDYDVAWTTNSLGLRETELGSDKSGEIRILAIGDSFTSGLGVEYDEAWPYRLQQRLQPDGTTQVRVINAGIDGYNIRQMRQYATELLPVLEPDLLVVGIFVGGIDRLRNPYGLVGDHLVRQNMLGRVQLGDNAFHYASLRRPEWAVGLEIWMTRHFLAGAYAIQGLNALRRKLLFFGNRQGGGTTTRDVETVAMEKELMALMEIASVRSIPLVAFLIAGQRLNGEESYLSINDSAMAFHSLIEAFCVENDLACVDGIAVLNEATNRGEYLRFPQDGHWNARGHDIGAQALASSPELRDALQREIGRQSTVRP